MQHSRCRLDDEAVAGFHSLKCLVALSSTSYCFVSPMSYICVWGASKRSDGRPHFRNGAFNCGNRPSLGKVPPSSQTAQNLLSPNFKAIQSANIDISRPALVFPGQLPITPVAVSIFLNALSAHLYSYQFSPF
jgi:hypothetical protein